MGWSALIALALELLKQRAAAGFPLLMKFLELLGWKIQADADADTSPITMGAAPDEVKDQIIAWLKAQQAKARPLMVGVYALVIRFVPLIADQLWDQLFAKGAVAKPLSDFTPAVFAAVGETEEEICKELAA